MKLRQRWAEGKARWQMWWLAFFAGLLGAAGCATCLTPESRAAEHGIVLECTNRYDGVECLVSTQKGDKKFFYEGETVKKECVK